MDDEMRAILDAQRRILRYLRNAAATTHRSLGLSAAQLFVVQTIADASEPLSVNELAVRTYTDQSTISVVAKTLEERGLVARRRSAEDGRRVDLSVTLKGRALLRRKLASPQHGLLDGVRRLSPDARAGLAKFLPELLAAMGLDRAPAPMMFEDEGRTSRPRRPRKQ
jgi:DNA-binding MarR family transcriptional regulator